MYFLPIILLLTLWFTFARKRTSSIQAKKKEHFWENESIANNTRKTSLECLDYITIPLNLVTLSKDRNDDTLVEYCNTLKILSEKKIVNLTGISNTDLKLKYGSPNLHVLSQYDENFTLLIKTLHALGKHLSEIGESNLAILVLEFCVTCGSDISHTYKLLSKLYQDTNQSHKIKWLLASAKDLNSLSKDIILKHLENLENSSVL